MARYLSWAPAVGLALAAVALAGCGKKAEAPVAEAVVSVTYVKASPLQLSDDLPGRVVAFRSAQIRPQVAGIVQRRLFTEGGQVRAGQPLFQINASPFQADLDSADAAVQRAQAVRARAKIQVDRLRGLLATEAVSQQVYDDAAADLAQAEADVAASRATAARRRLDVAFATITSPIAGRIGAASVTEGALVGTGDTTPLATVNQIDQVYIDVRQPVARLLALRAAGESQAPVEILDADGAPMNLRGRLLFSDLQVDPSTGEAVARVLVDNRSGRLLPGMFVRARLPRGPATSLPQVPQQAVFRQGEQAQLVVIRGDGSSETRSVQVGDVVDNSYVVLSGIKAGERVVVEGRDKLAPGAPVKLVVWKTPPITDR